MVSHDNGQPARSGNGEYRKSLQEKTRRELASLARRQRIPGWHPMRKSELVDALARAARQNGSHPKKTRRKPKPQPPLGAVGIAGAGPDLLVAESVSSRWISARWNVSSRMLARAESALGSDWHRARAVLRVLKITEDAEGPASESRVRDVKVEIETAECCFEIDRVGLPYRVQLGFAVPGRGDFFALSHSDPVSTPRNCQSHDGRQPSHATARNSRSSPPAASAGLNALDDLPLEIHTDLVIYGRTAPETLIELDQASVIAGRDGRFELRLPLENGRQFVPGTATAGDRASKRQVALSVERHLKVLDPEPTDRA